MTYLREFLSTLTVLYVEDSDFSRESLAYYLSRRCKKVDMAQDGQMGLDMFKSNRYDVVLTDVKMPVMDGFEMARRIKALNKNIPIIVITAHNEPETVETANAAGVDSLIFKPFLPEKVTEEIYRCTTAKEVASG